MNPEEIAQLSYEEARTQLVNIAQGLESRDIALEDALQMWEQGQALANHCENILKAAKQRVEEAASTSN